MRPRLAAGADRPALALNWTVEVVDGDQALDLTGARAVIDQVGFVVSKVCRPRVLSAVESCTSFRYHKRSAEGGRAIQ